jgi:succinoglycan biosynthesis protein ExoM
MLRALVVAADEVAPLADVAAIVVDDNPDGRARQVADEFEGRFSKGVHYRRSGEQNISIARNLGLDTAIALGDWVAMTDDDCEPDPAWLRAFVEVQMRTGADALTGPLVMRFKAGSPRWLLEQPFSEHENEVREDGIPMPLAQTHNSAISTEWLKAHPEVRFDPALGRLGGEDMVFYRQAVDAGLRIHYARDAVVHEEVTDDRATLRSQLRAQFWLGNTEFVTNVQSGSATRPRMALRSARRLASAIQRPFARLARRQSPQWRWCLASVLRSTGMLLGVFGVRVNHH